MKAFTKRSNFLCFITIILVFVVISATKVDTAKAAPFYEGKTIEFIVPWPVGGGFDTTARLIARHIKKYIPGEPSIIVQNKPGGAGMRGVNYAYNRGSKEGLTFINVSSGALDQQLISEPGVNYDVRKLNFIGSFGMAPFVLLIKKELGLTTVDDLMNYPKELIIGSSGPASVTTVNAKALDILLGIKIKLISGYKGIPPIVLAIERGEVQATIATYKHRSAWRLVKENIASPVRLQLGIKYYPTLKEKGWPLITDFLKDQESKELAKIIWGPSSISRGTVATSPGVPADRVKMLRNAYDNTVRDPAFLSEAKRFGYIVTPTEGEKLQEFISEYLGMPQILIEKYKTALRGK